MMKKYLAILLVAMSFAAATASAAGAEKRPAIETAAPASSVRTGSGYMEVTATTDTPVRFYIYSITGQLVKTVDVAAGSTVIELPRGYYIVKCAEWSKQVVVK